MFHVEAICQRCTPLTLVRAADALRESTSSGKNIQVDVKEPSTPLEPSKLGRLPQLIVSR